MKFAYTWLKDLSGYNGTPEKLAETLSTHAFEAEVVSGTEFRNIIVAKVTSIEKHPNADRLRIITLNDGTNTISPVVCGAWNFEEGAVVALALPGATIPHDQHDPEGKPFVLAKAVIRGVESQGMLCSGKELGLSDDGKGIMLLDADYKVGETFVARGGETYLDISLPANRPDLLGYLGVAREISALTNSKYNFKSPKFDLKKLKPKTLKVNISNSKLCPRYIAVRLSAVEIGPSPDFIQQRIKLSGHHPINNVVDITNYVMLETGQPLHAFDAGKILGPVSVRSAYMNEKIKTLDGLDRALNPQNLVIADSKQIIGIAGIMGGANSMIDEFTTEVILECANFDSVSIRKTSRELGIRTDASARYEKSLPIALTNFAASYCIELLIKYAGARVVEAVTASSRPTITKRISLSADKLNNLLGIRVAAADQKKILEKFNFKVTGSNPMNITVPFERADINIWQDLAEEIGRYEGLDKIDPVTTNVVPSLEMTDEIVDQRRAVAQILVGEGYCEIYTYSFVSEKDLETWDIERKIAVEVANPLSSDQQYMRPNLLMNGIKSAQLNSRLLNAGNYFEIGNIYWREDRRVVEKTYLSMISFDKDYPGTKLSSSFRELCNRLGVNITIDQELEQMANIRSGKKIIGHIGHVEVSDIKWVGVHLDFHEFIKLIGIKSYTPAIKYPSRVLDVAVFARRDLAWGKIEQLIKSINSEIIQRIELFDVYSGKNVPLNRKSIAFRIVYQSQNKTLTDEEVQEVHDEVLKELKTRLNLEVR